MPVFKLKTQDGTVITLASGDQYEVRSAPDSDIWEPRQVVIALTNWTLLVYAKRTQPYTTTRRILQDLFDLGDLRKRSRDER